jgi:hypothetical protein
MQAACYVRPERRKTAKHWQEAGLKLMLLKQTLADADMG